MCDDIKYIYSINTNTNTNKSHEMLKIKLLKIATLTLIKNIFLNYIHKKGKKQFEIL